MEANQERGEVLQKKRELACEGTILKVYRDFVVANDREESWDFTRHDSAAIVVLVFLDGGILMVRQYRNALDRSALGLPTGKVDSPEKPHALYAFRELSEGTGMRAESLEVLEFLLRIDTIVALCDREIDIFVVQNLLPGGWHLDPGEVINMQIYELSGLLMRTECDEIRDVKIVAGLTAYALKQS